MTHKHHLDRSALTAIAAVLAFSATPSLAQDASAQSGAPATGDVSPSTPPAASPPVVADAPVAPSTAAPAPAAPATGAAVTLPQLDATAPVPQAAPTTNAAPALPQIATTPAPQTVQSIPANAEPEPQGPAERAAPVQRRTAQAERAPAAPAAEQRAAAPATPAASPAPAEPVTPPPAEAVATQEQAPAPAAAPAQANATADDSNPALWALGAGGVLAVAGLGFMALRSRRRPEITYAGEVVTEMPPASVAPRVEPEIPVAAATAYAQTPVAATPTFAAVAATPRAAVTTGKMGGETGSLEALVAEAPSATNPFVTRRNRMRRAKFILAHGEAPVATTGNRQYPDLAAAKQGVGNAAIKPARVYDFGKATTTRWPNWKPATS